jgi:TonB family protein
MPLPNVLRRTSFVLCFSQVCSALFNCERRRRVNIVFAAAALSTLLAIGVLPVEAQVGNGTTPPSIISKVDPEYSNEASAAKLSGSVMLSIIVNTDGKAEQITVVKSLGMGLDEKAIEAVQKWRFLPAKNNGVPVNVKAQIEVSFRLPPPATNADDLTLSATGQKLSVTVNDEVGTPVAGASTLFLAADGRFIAGRTGADGRVSLNTFGTSGFKVLCGRDGFYGYVGNIGSNSSVATMEVLLKARQDGGSIVITGTGYIPGLKGRLEPAVDPSMRNYLYATNIAINGGEAQPVHFEVGEKLRAIDADGKTFDLRILAIGGKSSLIDYHNLAAAPVVTSPVAPVIRADPAH